MHLYLPVQTKSKTDKTVDIPDVLMTVNIFLAYCFKKVCIRTYRDDVRILPANGTVDIYRYSNSLLKHMPESFENLWKYFIIKQKPVTIKDCRETGLSDFHKMNLTVLKMYFIKQKHETIFYRNYKKFDNLKFKEALNRELMKHDLNNIDYEIFHEIVVSILNAHALF